MRFLSQQPGANFIALQCKPGAISRPFYSEINLDLGATHWNTITLNSSFATAQVQTLCSPGSSKHLFFISLMTIIKKRIQNLEMNKELSGKWVVELNALQALLSTPAIQLLSRFVVYNQHNQSRGVPRDSFIEKSQQSFTKFRAS